MSEGIIFTAVGDSFRDEVKKTSDNVKEYMPNTNIVVFSDEIIDHSSIDRTILVKNPMYSYGDCILSSEQLPFDKNLRLDTDIRLLGDVSDIFDMLDRFEFVANPISPGYGYFETNDIPNSFPVFNGGVLGLRNCSNVHTMLDKWQKYFNETPEQKFNQPSLRKALYKSNVSIAPLPPEYNCFILDPGKVSKEIKIIHGRHPKQREIASELNDKLIPRTFDQSKYPINVRLGRQSGDHSIYYQFRRSIDEHGFTRTLQRIFSKIIQQLKSLSGKFSQ